jgi:hypothetical protein
VTKAEKRVEIAKDVLKQIKADKYKPMCGVWFRDSTGKGLDDFLDYNTGQRIDAKKDVVEKLVGTCKVCALGSLFISAIDKYNHTKLDPASGCEAEIFTAVDRNNPLTKWFTARQMLLIENTFENECGAWCSSVVLNEKEYLAWDMEVIPAIKEYNSKYPNPTDRLKAIMNNIVRNKGTFVLPGVKL